MKEVLRSKENVPFTQIANAVLVDKDISLKAKGLFAYIYSKPSTWDFAASRMAYEMKEARDAIETGLQELEKAGYLIRTRQGDGRMDYDISYNTNRPKPMRDNTSKVKALRGKIPHISNKDSYSNKDKERNKETAPQSSALPKADSFFDKRVRKERTDDATPMNLQEFVLMCRGSAYRHIKIIAEYADEKKSAFETRGQWREFGRRNLAVARRLVPFSDRQMSKAMEKMEKDLKCEGGFISKWTLETLEKYLD